MFIRNTGMKYNTGEETRSRHDASPQNKTHTHTRARTHTHTPIALKSLPQLTSLGTEAAYTSYSAAQPSHLTAPAT
jgi:hypothetical protein